jgi:hypothetical protein
MKIWIARPLLGAMISSYPAISQKDLKKRRNAFHETMTPGQIRCTLLNNRYQFDLVSIADYL